MSSKIHVKNSAFFREILYHFPAFNKTKPCFFSLIPESVYKNSAYISAWNPMLSKIYNGTVYKKELIQRNMDTKMSLLNGIKKTKLAKSITAKCAESNLRFYRKI